MVKLTIDWAISRVGEPLSDHCLFIKNEDHSAPNLATPRFAMRGSGIRESTVHIKNQTSITCTSCSRKPNNQTVLLSQLVDFVANRDEEVCSG